MSVMRAAWYDKQGPAQEVLQVGDLPIPQLSPDEVLVRVAASGIHAGDLGKRQGWWGSTMLFPRVVPHSDGAGVIVSVGAHVPKDRVGQRVWVFLAQSYRPFGTAAQYATVRARHAIALPHRVPFEQGASLGIPGITGHRAVFADGPVLGATVLVTGAAGSVGRAAVAVARRGGATVIGTVRAAEQVDAALAAGCHHVVDLAGGDVAKRILELTGGIGVDRVADVAFDGNLATTLEVVVDGGMIATYASVDPEPTVPFWRLACKNITVRFLSNDDFPEDANQAAAAALTEAVCAGDLRYPIAARFRLDQIADAHDAAAEAAGRVVIDL